ncbi:MULTISPECIES: hypothetical protein [unclassified Pseudomonas]|uniref:hypothetical protein n=1 Tax=unclassified Pseudomonas TaxID=196821 RepID=UPI001F362500|nr:MULTISPECIES: hypothetical protein [unclassified Pseudomonas]
MMKDIDSLMRHWAEQRRQGPSGLGSQMGSIMEWKGLAPRTGASGSRILIAGAGMDHAAAEIEAAVAELDRRDARGRVLARLALFRYVHEAAIREQMREVGLEEHAERTYWNWVAALHLQVARILVSRVGPNRANTVRRVGMRRARSESAPK